jgi:hypothetical protein
VLTVEANPAVVVVNSTITGNEYGLILQDQEGSYPPRDGEHVRLL